jgi:hypothetical protein
MFKYIFLLSILPIVVFSKLTNQQELRRQYSDFLNIFKKDETPLGFETFIQNLNTIEDYNKQNNGCRMYLTQHSDTFEDEFLHEKCRK